MLTGCNVVITGATGSLGRALSLAFWNAGANLFLTGRSLDRLNELGRTLDLKENQTLDLVASDLTDTDGADGLITAVSLRWQKVHVLVNNAGTLGPVGPLWENDWNAWSMAMRMNLLVPISLCRGLIPIISRGGSIINISGGGATSPRPNFTAYGTSKAALVRFSETLAAETESLGIRVNCIAPGIMRSRMVEKVVEIGPAHSGLQEFRKALEVMEKGGTPPETPAELAVMLASKRGADITGKLLSAAWDPWHELPDHVDDLARSDVYTLRRVVPADRAMNWGGPQ